MIKEKFDEFYFHEALDRTHVLLCNIDDHLLSHPVIMQNEELRLKVEGISVALYEVYTDIANINLNEL